MYARISKHFHEKEFACPCCGEVKVDERLVEALEQLRLRCGGRPIIVHSGFRCNNYNAKVGGAPRSYHLKGMAADISIQGLSGHAIGREALSIEPIRGIGVANFWAHVDVRQGRLVTWRYAEGGRKIYGVLA